MTISYRHAYTHRVEARHGPRWKTRADGSAVRTIPYAHSISLTVP